MRTTIDSAGRVVIPKPMRQALGLHGGQELEISTRDGRIELDVPATSMRLEERDGVVAAVPAVPLPTLTGDVVRQILEQTRR
jgi:AbrB family looped-hinge helix DNA binding protein